MNCCFIKKKRIVPKKVSYLIDDKISKDDRVSKDITDKYMNERISCGTCHNVFCLHQNKLTAICGGCNQFLHCGIAGKCIGPNCGNSFHRLSWCKKCVPKTVIINLQDLGPTKDCLCQECLDDPKTPSCYKKKI